MPPLFKEGVADTPASLTDYNANVNLSENSFKDLGPFIISGLAISIGTGLSVNVATGVASIGGRLTVGVGFAVGSLSASTTNHIYLKNDGTGTANTTGTQPANSVKLGTCITGASTVTSVQQNWTAGRQLLVRPDLQVHGAGAGHARAVDLASWSASGNEGFETKGFIAPGAISGSGFSQSTKTANYTATSTDYFIWCDATSGNITITLPTAVGIGGRSYVIKKIDASANTITIDANSTETVDGSLTHVIGTQYESRSIASNNSNWFIY